MLSVTSAAASSNAEDLNAKKTIACTLAPIENPHFSAKSGGVIAKSWMTCTGDATLAFTTSVTKGTAPIGPNPVVLNVYEVQNFTAGVRDRVWLPTTKAAACTNGRYYRVYVTVSAASSGGTVDSGGSTQVQINNCA